MVEPVMVLLRRIETAEGKQVMSRIGKQPVVVPSGVNVTVTGKTIAVSTKKRIKYTK